MRAVNLLPPELRAVTRRAKGSGAAADAPGATGPFVVLGALALCVVALAGYVLAGNVIKDRQAELASVTAQEAAVAQQAAALEPYADFATLAQQRVDDVKTLAAQRFDWHRALADLSRAIPAGVTLASVDGTADGAAAPSIALDGCTTGRVGVSNLMSQLRAVRGVDSVALTSAKRTEAQESGSDGVQSEAPCGAGSAVEFQIKVGFEGTVSAATTTATAATTTTSTSEGTTAP
jgi:Tfp pilus assembly protein PilN